jgi:hypothetical protein
MKLFKVAFAALATLLLIAKAHALDIQAAIDALPPQGGVVQIPEGDHPGPAITLRSNVALICANKGTTKIPPIADSPIRIYNVVIRDCIITGALNSEGKAYGADLRRVTNGHFENIHITGFAYGIVMLGEAYYNLFENITISASNTAVSLSGGANQNTFVGGKWSAPLMLQILQTNGTTVIGTSLETGDPGAVFRQIVGDNGTTSARGVRQEKPGYGPVMWDTP